MPSELSFNLDPCVAREVSLGNANGGDALGVLVGESPGGNALSDFLVTTPTAEYG